MYSIRPYNVNRFLHLRIYLNNNKKKKTFKQRKKTFLTRVEMNIKRNKINKKHLIYEKL